MLLAGCIIHRDDEILLLKRIATGWYELPGGKVEPDEKPEDAAVRELKEEIGCDVRIISKFGEMSFHYDNRDFQYIWFNAELVGENTLEVVETDMFAEARFIRISELDQYQLSPNMKNLLSQMRR
jgi:8-oxo-dGTP diphosphatase